MDKQVMQARRESGLARFERTTKGWKTPGTREAGQHANLVAHMNRILRRIRGDKQHSNYNLTPLEMEIKSLLQEYKSEGGAQ
ncbi:MAG TPA: hypothetical protein EYN66_06020 [Myxococcales bacterium]|nr:hypothetical protein [Myxococcales bacterium]